MRCYSNRKIERLLLSSLTYLVCLFAILMKVLTISNFEAKRILKMRRCSINRNVYGATVRLKYFHCFYLLHFVDNKHKLFYFMHRSIYFQKQMIADTLIHNKEK